MNRNWFDLLRWWWLVALTTVLAAGVAYLVSRSLTPTYSASTLIIVDQSQNSVTTDYSSVLASQQLTRTYGQLITTHPYLAAAIAQLKLSMTPDELDKLVKTTVVVDTQLVSLSVENTDPALARDLANTIATVFIDQYRKNKLGQSASSEQAIRQDVANNEAQVKETTVTIDQAKASGGQAADILQLQTLLAQQQSAHSTLVHSLEQVQLDQARISDQLRIVGPAELPTVPVRPRTLLNVGIAAAVGVILGLAAAFLLEYLDDTVKTAKDIEDSVRLTSLGSISRIPWQRASGKALLSAEQNDSPVAEAYRIVRTNIDFARVGQKGKVLMVTSANEQEGKSTTTLNLGIIFGQSGRSVVVVDADLRRPSLNKVLNLNNDVGLTNLLLEEDPIVARAIQPTPWPNLSVLTSGPIPPNPADLVGSDQMRLVIDRLQESVDLVLIDSPPCLAVADASIMTALADGVILVVDAGKTRVEALVRAKERLDRGASAHLLGVVLNRLASRGAGYYQYRYSYSSRDGKTGGSSSNGRGTLGQIRGWFAAPKRS